MNHDRSAEIRFNTLPMMLGVSADEWTIYACGRKSPEADVVMVDISGGDRLNVAAA